MRNLEVKVRYLAHDLKVNMQCNWNSNCLIRILWLRVLLKIITTADVCSVLTVLKALLQLHY